MWNTPGELPVGDLRESCLQSSVGLPVPISEWKEPNSYGRCGHLPHRTLRHGRRLLSLPVAKKKTWSADITFRERSAHPVHLCRLEPFHQREGHLGQSAKSPTCCAASGVPPSLRNCYHHGTREGKTYPAREPYTFATAPSATKNVQRLSGGWSNCEHGAKVRAVGGCPDRTFSCEGIRSVQMYRINQRDDMPQDLRKLEPLVSFTRQAETECRSPIICVLGYKVTTLGPRELSGDGKTQTRAGTLAASAGCLRPVEAVENTG